LRRIEMPGGQGRNHIRREGEGGLSPKLLSMRHGVKRNMKKNTGQKVTEKDDGFEGCKMPFV
jgi:hypothetical protein